MSKPNSGRFKKGEHWRPRQPWWDRAWLVEQYADAGRSAADIAQEGGVTENAILFWLKKHGIKTRSMREVRAAKHWGASGVDNPMWNNRGELNPNWRGGVTAERQAFYASQKWKAACSAVWKRDKAKCRRCGLRRDDSPDMPMHIHHIEPFAIVAKRADIENLVLLCEACHQFVHSKANVHREYLPQV
jgi:5-methylcytosine-specific restriction endonuclease McrA